MKKILLALALLLGLPAAASAQCNGVFPNGTVCGNNTGASNTPRAVSPASLQGAAGGLNGQVQYNNAGVLGGLTNTQLTALVNPFTSTLSGAVPAGGTNPLLFLNQTGTWTAPIPQNPGNLYLNPAGSDSNDCLTVGTACQTVQHAFTLAAGYQYNGTTLTINLSAGTFNTGGVISGTVIGATHSGFGKPGRIQLVGAGVGATALAPSAGGGCGTTHGILATDGAIVGVGSMVIATTCAGGSSLVALDGALIYLVDDNVQFNGSSNAHILVSNAKFDANYSGSHCLTIAGNATFAFAGSTNGIIVTGIGCSNTIVGTPNFSGSFISMIDGSFYNEGINSSWVNGGNVVGTRYSLAINGRMDREQSIQPVPGTNPGTLEGLSIYYANGLVGGKSIDLPCVGGAVGCRNATAPTGLGTGGTAAMKLGSGDHGGTVTLTTGTGPSASGTVVVAQNSILTGDYGTAGACVVSLDNSGSTWPASSMVQANYTTTGLAIAWSGAISASLSYNISYICN